MGDPSTRPGGVDRVRIASQRLLSGGEDQREDFIHPQRGGRRAHPLPLHILHMFGRAFIPIAFLSSLPYVAVAQSGQTVDDLPTTVRQASTPNALRTLVILVTGDGGFAKADREVTDLLHTHGASVVALDSRKYLRDGRTPEQAAADVARLVRYYLAAWKLDRLIVLGYSRGADMAPFVVRRLPDDLRARIDLVAMFGLATTANFHFHWIDLVRSVHRPDDVPTAPELTALRGLNALCVYGTDETDSGCRSADSTLVKRYSRNGGHRLTDGYEAAADLIVPFLGAR